MKSYYFRLLLSAALYTTAINVVCSQTSDKSWTLEDCIEYAMANNIKLQKDKLKRQSAEEDLMQSKATLLPSLSFSMSHNLGYSPWRDTERGTVANGYVQNSVDKTYYNGSYGINANWTIWNGNRNLNTIKQNRLAAEQAELDSIVTANAIEEQIIMLYMQILYSTDAIMVNKTSLEASRKNEERGEEMVSVGKMSKADLAQLTAQRAQDEYNIVAAESALRNYKLQLKQLLEITDSEEMNIAVPESTDEQAMEEIPALNSVYAAALGSRPEIKNRLLAIESNELEIKKAKAGKLPTIGLTAGVGTNTTSMNDSKWNRQFKVNVDASLGVTFSMPLFDNRQTKTAVNKAVIERETNRLELKEDEKELYATIEGYWLDAVTNQNKFKAAKAAVKSETMSYELLSEQFRLGLKNIVELMTGKTNLVTAQQNELQSKYMTMMNIELLKFYQK